MHTTLARKLSSDGGSLRWFLEQQAADNIAGTKHHPPRNGMLVYVLPQVPSTHL